MIMYFCLGLGASARSSTHSSLLLSLCHRGDENKPGDPGAPTDYWRCQLSVTGSQERGAEGRLFRPRLLATGDQKKRHIVGRPSKFSTTSMPSRAKMRISVIWDHERRRKQKKGAKKKVRLSTSSSPPYRHSHVPIPSLFYEP
jgi:hypothetical protein